MSVDTADYAVFTADTSFKHVFSIEKNNSAELVTSFLNCFCPTVDGSPISNVETCSVVLPVIRRTGEKQVLMDFHVVSKAGTHYIVEVQVQRHIMFDERALFYAASTYSQQLTPTQLAHDSWYIHLKPVIALQIVDYDTNRARGITTNGEGTDTLIDRVKACPMQDGQYTKHFEFKDKISGQIINHIQIVQVELPRAKPSLAVDGSLDVQTVRDRHLTEKEWWLTLMKYANKFTEELVHNLTKEKLLPPVIEKAFARLKFSSWLPEQVKKYNEDIHNLSLFNTMIETAALDRSKELLDQKDAEIESLKQKLAAMGAK